VTSTLSNAQEIRAAALQAAAVFYGERASAERTGEVIAAARRFETYLRGELSDTEKVLR
jgi:hypothetical protein